jgi:hypothetical protein
LCIRVQFWRQRTHWSSFTCSMSRRCRQVSARTWTFPSNSSYIASCVTCRAECGRLSPFVIIGVGKSARKTRRPPITSVQIPLYFLGNFLYIDGPLGAWCICWGRIACCVGKALLTGIVRQEIAVVCSYYVRRPCGGWRILSAHQQIIICVKLLRLFLHLQI